MDDNEVWQAGYSAGFNEEDLTPPDLSFHQLDLWVEAWWEGLTSILSKDEKVKK